MAKLRKEDIPKMIDKELNTNIRLQTWKERDKSLTCPGCGRRLCYKEYVYRDTGEALDKDNHMVGMCDHRQSCGYHMPPKEWFHQHPEASKRAASTSIISANIKRLKRIEIDPKIVSATMTAYDINTFIQWVKTLPLTDEQRHMANLAVQAYCIGTSKDGGVIWWQIDDKGIIRTGKKMVYNTQTGKRLKDIGGTSTGINWIHAMMRKKGMYPESEYELKQTLFGMHLASADAYNDCSIHIVESEKTAFLMSIFDPETWTKKVWVATGGLFNFKVETLQPILKRDLVIYPDANGVELWKEKMKEQGIKGKLVTKWIDYLIEEDGKGADIADVVLRRLSMSDEARFEEVKKHDPVINMLANKLDLKPIKQ